MPLDPNHIHAEVPHERTVHLASQGWRYGCRSARMGDDKPRGGRSAYVAHPWARTGTRVVVVTHFLPILCGHSTRATDAACEGCCNRGEES